MKRKECLISVFICLFILLYSCATYRKGIVMLNEDITKAQYRAFPKYLSLTKEWEKDFRQRGGDFCVRCLLFEDFRLYRYCSGFFNEIKQNDTIYIIESISEPYKQFNLIIWNRVDTAAFYAYGVLEKTSNEGKERAFSECEMQLVGQWNIERIRYEEEKSTLISGETIRYATRVIIKKRKNKIDCIRYRQFGYFNKPCTP